MARRKKGVPRTTATDPGSGLAVNWGNVAEPPRIRRFFLEDTLRTSPLSIDLIRFSLVVSDHDYVFPLHRPEFPELAIPVSGTYRCLLNGVEVAVDPGYGLLIIPDDMHEDRVRRGVRYLAVVFDMVDAASGGRFQRLLHGGSADPKRRSFRLADFADWTRLFLRRDPATRGDTLLHRQEWSALGTALIWRSLEAMRGHLSREFLELADDNAFHREVARIFNEHLGRPLSMAGLARSLGLSRRGLTKKCKRALGETPARLFAAHRVGHARKLLSSGMNPKAVTRRLGFANQSHFARVFRRCTGAAPSDFYSNI